MTSPPARASFVEPPVWRVFLAFLIAPGALLGPLALISWALEQSGPVATPILSTIFVLLMGYCAYPTALFVGVPAYVLVHKRFGVSLESCFLIGMVVAALTWSGLFVLLGLFTWPGATDFRDTMAAVLTLALGAFAIAFPTGALGAVSGLIFWFILNVGRKPPLAGARDPA